jgi:hypothetical protein
MFFIICTQLLELKIPHILVRHHALGIESKTNLVELRFSLRINFVSFEDGSLPADPTAQFIVFLVLIWHIACNARRDTSVVLVGMFKMKTKRSRAQNNSQ